MLQLNIKMSEIGGSEIKTDTTDEHNDKTVSPAIKTEPPTLSRRGISAMQGEEPAPLSEKKDTITPAKTSEATVKKIIQALLVPHRD